MWMLFICRATLISKSQTDKNSGIAVPQVWGSEPGDGLNCPARR